MSLFSKCYNVWINGLNGYVNMTKLAKISSLFACWYTMSKLNR